MSAPIKTEQWLFHQRRNEIHLFPVGKGRTHTSTKRCSCGPDALKTNNGTPVFVHYAGEAPTIMDDLLGMLGVAFDE
jgi:hypothetical protein